MKTHIFENGIYIRNKTERKLPLSPTQKKKMFKKDMKQKNDKKRQKNSLAKKETWFNMHTSNE